MDRLSDGTDALPREQGSDDGVIEVPAGVDIEPETRMVHHPKDRTCRARLLPESLQMPCEGAASISGCWSTCRLEDHHVRAIASMIRHQHVAGEGEHVT